MLLEVFQNVTWLEKEYIIRFTKKITWLDKENVIRYFE